MGYSVLAGTLSVAGRSYEVQMVNLSSPIIVDLDGNGQIEQGARVVLQLESGIELQPGVNTSQSDVVVRFANVDERFDVHIAAGPKMRMNVLRYLGPRSGGTEAWNRFAMLNDNADDRYTRGLTDLGVKIDIYSTSTQSDSLTVSAPANPALSNVSISMG